MIKKCPVQLIYDKKNKKHKLWITNENKKLRNDTELLYDKEYEIKLVGYKQQLKPTEFLKENLNVC